MPQNIFLFLEPTTDKWRFPIKIGNLYMNRFAINENDANEIITNNDNKIFELKEFFSVPSHLNTEKDDHVSHKQIDSWYQESLQKRQSEKLYFKLDGLNSIRANKNLTQERILIKKS